MRKNIHRVLSGLPLFGLAVLGLWAAAAPLDTNAAYKALQSHLAQRPPLAWGLLAIIVLYAALWWHTSAEPISRRRRIQLGLQPHFETLSRFQQRLQEAQTPADVEELMPAFRTALEVAGGWIQANMSQAAFEKFKAPTVSAAWWPWPGKAQGAAESRSNALSLNKARLGVLDTFLQSDGWDGPE